MSQIPFINIHTHFPKNDEEYILAYSIGIDTQPQGVVNFSAGIHPWSVEQVDCPDALEYLTHAPVVAIGEIGLDFVRNVDRDLQIRTFEAQLDIAQKRNLPVIIHCVKAYNEVLDIIRNRELKSVVFHGYVGSVQQTQTIINRGYYISLGEVSLKSSRTIESIKKTPLDRIFTETDMSEIAVKKIYSEILKIKNISLDELKVAIDRNYRTVFK